MNKLMIPMFLFIVLSVGLVSAIGSDSINLEDMVNEIYGNTAYSEFTQHFPHIYVHGVYDWLYNQILIQRYEVHSYQDLWDWIALNGITEQDLEDFNGLVHEALSYMQDTQINLWYAIEYNNTGNMNMSNYYLGLTNSSYQNFLVKADEVNVIMYSWNPLH